MSRSKVVIWAFAHLDHRQVFGSCTKQVRSGVRNIDLAQFWCESECASFRWLTEIKGVLKRLDYLNTALNYS